MRLDPSGSTNRRRLAVIFLLIGAIAVVATVDKDYPREQPIVFRLADTRAARLTASFTKVGEAEPRTGFTLAVSDRAFRDVSHTIRVPNGDYIVTIEVRHQTPKRATSVGAGAPTLTNSAPTLTNSAPTLTNSAPTLTNSAPTTNDGPNGSLASAEETTVSRRVSLAGSEVVVSVPARASE
jgi:hypothetical protein